MTLVVNGEETNCPDGLSLAQFIEHLGLKADRIAVELNREIARRNRWQDLALKSGDRLEIVHFVGGGCGRLCSSFSTRCSSGEVLFQKRHSGVLVRYSAFVSSVPSLRPCKNAKRTGAAKMLGTPEQRGKQA